MFTKKKKRLMMTLLMSLLIVGACSKKEVAQPKIKETKVEKTQLSSPKEVTDFKFDKTILTKEELVFEVGAYTKAEQTTLGTNKIEIKLYSNVPTKTSPDTVEYPFENSNIRIVGADEKELSHERGELQVASGSGLTSFIKQKNEATKTVFTEYYFKGETPKIKVRLVDDHENIMFESDWIEKTEKVLPAIFDKYSNAEDFSLYVLRLDALTKGEETTTVPTIENPDIYTLETDAKPIYAVRLHATPTTIGDSDKFNNIYVLADDGFLYTSVAQADENLVKGIDPNDGILSDFDPTGWAWKEGLKEEYLAVFKERDYISDAKPYWITPSSQSPGIYCLYVEENGAFRFVVGMKTDTYFFHG